MGNASEDQRERCPNATIGELCGEIIGYLQQRPDALGGYVSQLCPDVF